MRLRAVGGAACVASVLVIGCGLDEAGLGDAPEGGWAEGDAAAIESSTGGGDGDAPAGDAWAPGEAGADGGTHSDATGGDGDAPSDGTSGGTTDGTADVVDAPVTGDESPPGDGGCPGVVCNGGCSPDHDCHECPGAPLLCGATQTCGSSCSACATGPIQCFACDTNRQNPIGTCQPDNGGSYCLNTTYTGQYQGGTGTHCGCLTSSDCPGESQVCISVGQPPPPPTPPTLGCFTCGEAATQGQRCKSGGQCNGQKATCN